MFKYFQLRLALLVIRVRIRISLAQQLNTEVPFSNQLKVRSDSIKYQYKFDSLKRLIATAPNDTLKIMRLTMLSSFSRGSKKPTIAFASATLSTECDVQIKLGGLIEEYLDSTILNK